MKSFGTNQICLVSRSDKKATLKSFAWFLARLVCLAPAFLPASCQQVGVFLAQLLLCLSPAHSLAAACPWPSHSPPQAAPAQWTPELTSVRPQAAICPPRHYEEACRFYNLPHDSPEYQAAEYLVASAYAKSATCTTAAGTFIKALYVGRGKFAIMERGSRALPITEPLPKVCSSPACSVSQPSLCSCPAVSCTISALLSRCRLHKFCSLPSALPARLCQLSCTAAWRTSSARMHLLTWSAAAGDQEHQDGA